MIIKIEDLPNGQIIKDISINISFEDGQVKEIKQTSNPSVLNNSIKSNIDVTSTQIQQSVQSIPNVSNVSSPQFSEPNSIIPEIDLSKREHKIDSAMMDESF